MHYNLRESGRVDTGLHEALQAFSERNQSRLLNDEKRSATLETLYTRYDTGIFKRTRNPQLKAVRELILAECDDYAAQVYGDQVRQARRDHTMWFVVQRSGQAKDAVHAHYHEGSDLAFVYYLTMPKDGSGQLVLMDPRGTVGRGGFVVPANAWQLAGRAVVSSTISQGIAVATGLQLQFNWTNVAAAGIGAGVGSAVGAQVFPNASDFGERLARGFVAGAVGGVAASVLSGGKANYLQIATDAFGNALGNSVVDEISLSGSSQSQSSSTNSASDERTRDIFRQQTMGDIQRLAAQEGGRGWGQSPVSLDETAFNDIGSLKELGRGPSGEIYWNNDVTSYPVADRRMIPAVPLAALLPEKPADSIREIGPLEGFLTFNKFGRFLSSAGRPPRPFPARFYTRRNKLAMRRQTSRVTSWASCTSGPATPAIESGPRAISSCRHKRRAWA